MIKFKNAKGFENKDIKLPIRKTTGSAGYDFYSNETITIPCILSILDGVIPHLVHGDFSGITPTMVSTGVTADFPSDTILLIYNRSSNPIKRGLVLANGTGVIDSDYSPKEIMGMFYNFSDHDYTIHKGDRIMQGVFQKFLLVDDDHATGKRNGGFGSTGD